MSVLFIMSYLPISVEAIDDIKSSTVHDLLCLETSPQLFFPARLLAIILLYLHFVMTSAVFPSICPVVSIMFYLSQ